MLIDFPSLDDEEGIELNKIDVLLFINLLKHINVFS